MISQSVTGRAGRRLHVGLDKRREHAALLLQEGLGFVVLQDVPPLHHDDQVGCEDGVDAVLKSHEEEETELD